MNKLLSRICRDQSAATAVEYGLIISMVVLAMLSALTSVADVSVGMWNDIAAKVAAS